MLKSRGAGTSLVGPRDENQDSYALVPALGLYVVADGMGGLANGRMAATSVTQTLIDAVERSRTMNLANVLAVAIGQSRAVITKQPMEMGSTVAAVLVRPSGTVEVAHVGDSRVYRLRDEKLTLLTRDHSVLSDWEDATGVSAPPAVVDQYGHLVTRALSTTESTNGFPTLLNVEAREGDRFLLSTDGVHDVLSFDFIRSCLLDQSPDVAVKQLTRVAVGDPNASDNATALVIDLFASTP